MDKKFEDTRTKALRAISTVQNNLNQHTNTNDNQRQNTPITPRFRANDSMKPFNLTVDHSPVELKAWIYKFTNYFKSSSMNTLEHEEQVGYFRNCLDPKLETRLMERLANIRSIFGENSCIAALEEEFKLIYPIFKRRADLLEMKQQESQSFRDFKAELKKIGKECHLESMNKNDIITLLYVTGTNDGELRKMFLKEKEATLEKFDEIADLYESSRNTSNSLSKGKPIYNIGPRYNTSHQNSKEQNIRKSEYKNINFKCIRCGKSGHKPDHCPKINTACNKCRKKGHISSV